jgi:GT2 family glycosyltransferase
MGRFDVPGGCETLTDLSIIIVSWNTKEYLLRCLKSVFQSENRNSWEVILVDNGSQDGSAGDAKRLFPDIHLIANETNLGFAKATNQGLKHSSGRYLLLLNPDTEVKQGAIQDLVRFMETHPDAGIAGAQLLNGDGSRQNSIANFPSLATELLNKSLLRRVFPKKFPGKKKDYVGPIEVDSVIGACMVTRRETLEQIGVLDEDYFLFFEETDWCFRIKRAGWKVFHFPQAKVIHFQGRGAETKKREAKVEYFHSRYHFFRKNRGGFQWLLLLIGLMIKLGFELLFTLIGCLLTGFLIKKWRKRLSIYAYLVAWHLRFCPRGMGLKPSNNH